MRYITLLLFIALYVSCTPNAPAPSLSPKEQKEAGLIETIHRIHDVETMPRMGHIVGMQKQLKASGDPGDALLAKNLVLAEDAMMDWMVQFKWQKKTETPIGERIEYYEDQVEKLDAMKAIMFKAIAEAEEKLGLESSLE